MNDLGTRLELFVDEYLIERLRFVLEDADLFSLRFRTARFC